MDEQLSGYLELGMTDEAERVAAAYLVDANVSSRTFSEALDAVLVSSDLPQWRPLVEQAYANLAAHAQAEVRFKMLSFYWSLHDLGNAHRFLDCDQVCDPVEFLIAMEIYIHLGRTVDAAAIARKCERLLKRSISQFDEGILRTALAKYYSHAGEPVRALNCWTAIPLNSSFLGNALVTTVELSLLPALAALDRAFDAIKQKKQQPDFSIAVQQPGLEDELTADIERDLNRIKRKINAIVSPARQRELGIACSRRAKSGRSALSAGIIKNKHSD